MGAALALLVLLGVTGCGGSTGPDRAEAPATQPPVTTPDGSVVRRPSLPTSYEADPSPSCERAIATFHDGSQPTKRPVVIPPAPGLRAVAVTEHTTRLEWSFRELPDDCRPVELLVSVVAAGDPSATPTTQSVRITGVAGTTEIVYPDFLPPPDVAHASAYSREGHRSRTVSVLVRRSADTPPDQPEAMPPITAPAGEPIRCGGRETVVKDEVGDILTYAPGSPPTRVQEITPALSGIDITQAAVQVDGRTVCARFVFASPPGSSDFELQFTLRDTTTPSCCGSLRFRRSAGRLEVGYFTVDANGAYQLEPVSNAGALLRDNTLLMTGTLPPPSAWQFPSPRMPAARNLGWSVTSTYSPDEYGPYYGDWLPRYEAVSQPLIRHRDGATVEAGAMH